MTDLPHPWAEYARLQAELLNNNRITNKSWAAEAALNKILAADPATDPPTKEEIHRTIATAERKERHRSMLRARHLQISEETPDHAAATHARLALASIKEQVPKKDWIILSSLGLGYNYAEIASKTGIRPNRLRTRVLRLRRGLEAQFAGATVQQFNAYC